MAQSPSVYLNHADVADLQSLAAIGAKARAVAENRPYSDWSELKRAGLDQDAINALKSQGVELGEPAEGPVGEPGSGGSAASPAGNLGRA
ncbi:MAG: hypothetical protein ACK4YQ_17520 [Phenylobacterium sp.]|uniref:hypothetical protein n=1 Tax=Phenylobacterium sp. TaxID=1871053 RepID=UPI0039192B93